jgi:hypothetical protein
MKNLSAVQFEALLVKLGACSEVRDWARGKTLREVWKTCKRGDWMLWLAARYGDVPLKTMVAIACDEAEPAMAYVPAGETRPQECLAMTRRWLKDEATIEEVKAAGGAAWAAKAAAGAAKAAAWAAEAAGGAAGAAAWAAWAAAWAAEAAGGAAGAAAWAAGAAAWAAKEAARAAKAAAWAAEEAARAAKAAAEAAAGAAWAAAGAESLRFSADLCRKYIEVRP